MNSRMVARSSGSGRRTRNPSAVVLQGVEAGVEQWMNRVAHVESFADRVVFEIAVVDAFEDRGELVRGEAEVEAEPDRSRAPPAADLGSKRWATFPACVSHIVG